MPNSNAVDLTAVLPVLRDAVAPFQAAVRSGAVNPATTIRAFAPVSSLRLGDLQRLLQAIEAVRRVAGDVP